MRTVLPLPFYAFLHEPCIRFGVAGGPGWSRTCVSLEGASRRCRFPREGVRLIELLACDSFADCTQHELQSFFLRHGCQIVYSLWFVSFSMTHASAKV